MNTSRQILGLKIKNHELNSFHGFKSKQSLVMFKKGVFILNHSHRILTRMTF